MSGMQLPKLEHPTAKKRTWLNATTSRGLIQLVARLLFHPRVNNKHCWDEGGADVIGTGYLGDCVAILIDRNRSSISVL